MLKGAISSLALIFVVVFAFLNPNYAWAQQEEMLGQQAEKAGKLREALTNYVAALQSVSEGSADDQRLRETIIKLVQKLSPPPAVSDEARRYSVRGQIAIKEAKIPADFEEAAKEFGKALRVAPWWADGYINQGVALEKAGKYTEAIRSLKFYLLAAPGAPDAEKIKEQIYALEYRQEKAQRDAVAAREEQERKQKEHEAYQRNLGFLAGRWVGTLTTHFERLNPPGRTVTLSIAVDVAVSGKEVRLTRLDTTPSDVLLIGRVTGNDYTSIRWEIARGPYTGQSVRAQVSPSRIYFSEPTQFGSQRLDDFSEYQLRK